MKTILPVITLALFALSSAASAGEITRSPNKGENIGLGAGLVAGALIGGPPGAILGAALGTHYGGSIARASTVPVLEEALQTSEAGLSSALDRAASLQTAMSDTERQLDALNQDVARLMTERAVLAGLHMEVLYTTGNAEINTEAKQRLQTLARVLKKIPDMDVQLDGFADQRGSETFNTSLSEARARGVEALLIAEGVSPDRIRISAFGEQQAQAADADGYAMERRVTVRLLGNGGASVAQNHSPHRHPSP